MSEDKRDKLLGSIKNEFDKSVENMDFGILSRLTQIRTRALTHQQGEKNLWYLVPVGVFVPICLALIIFTFVQDISIEQQETVDEIEFLTSAETLDFYDDLEFYEWLEEYELSG